MSAEHGSSEGGQQHRPLESRRARSRVRASSESTSLQGISLAIAWNGLPPYGLNAIRSLVVRFGAAPVVLGTHPDTSYDEIGKVAGLPIHWVDSEDRTVSWADYTDQIPDVFVVSGWATPAFNELGRRVRANGGAVIVMIDNRWRGDLRQLIAPIVFNTKYRNWFQAAIVPGKSARRFVRYLGLPNETIHEGLYGGNPNIFLPGPPLAERPLRFLFVGRFEERKGITELAKAWRTVQPQLPGWELHAVGEGALQHLLDSAPQVFIHPFKQINELADFYRSSRFLVLPSHDDHWGVVVHEAGRCGCGLLLSENVGARDDLANGINSFSFAAKRPATLADAILQATRLGERELRGVYHESLALAYRFGPQAFADSLRLAIAGLRR